MSETSDISSTNIIRLWCAITCVSGVMERKTYTWGSGITPIYPNLFTLIVADPASGKSQGISIVRNLWRRMKDLHVTPDDVSQASLIDNMSKAVRAVQLPNGQTHIFSAMAGAVDEFVVFFKKYDSTFMGVLNALYDGRDDYSDSKRGNGDVGIERPILTLLCGIQPGFLDEYLPENAWELGFMSRIIPILSTEKLNKPLLLRGNKRIIHSFENLANGLSEIFELAGEFEWTNEASEMLTAWPSYSGPDPVPEAKKLIHYIGRRSFNILKLSMVAAASRTQSLIVDVEDVLRAKQWLLDAEASFPKLFGLPKAKSDGNLIEEVKFFAKKVSESRPVGKSKCIKGEELWEFLSKQIAADRIPAVIKACEEAKVLIKFETFENIWKVGE
jgi:hypothetical protein